MLPGPDEFTEAKNRVEGKVAIVAGAGAIGDGWGNGKAAAYVYGKEGAQVLCVDYRADAAEETAEQIRGIGGDATAFAADVTDESAVAELVAIGSYNLRRSTRFTWLLQPVHR